MFLPPVHFIVDPDIGNQRPIRKLDKHGYGEPLDTIRCLNPIPVPPALLVILYVIIKDEDIGSVHLFKKSKPRQIPRLENPDDHVLFSRLRNKGPRENNDDSPFQTSVVAPSISRRPKRPTFDFLFFSA